MIWFRLGIVANDDKVRVDHGVLPNYTSDQVYEMLVNAFNALKGQNKQLLTQIMVASLEVMRQESGFEKGFEKLTELMGKDAALGEVTLSEIKKSEGAEGG